VDVGGVGHARRHLPVARFQAVVADHQNDRPFPTLAHVGDDRAYRTDVTHELQVEAREPVLFGELFEQTARGATRAGDEDVDMAEASQDRKSTRLNSSHGSISY